MEQHNIDSRFKESLGNLNRQPSADAWTRLQSKMAEAETAPVVVTEEPAEKKRGAWWLSIAAAVVLLLASIAVFRNLPETNQNQQQLANNAAKTVPSEQAKPEIAAEVVSPERTEIALVPAAKSNATEITSTSAQPAKSGKAVAVNSQVATVAKANTTSEPVIAGIEKTKAPITHEAKTVAPGAEKPETQLAYQAPEKAVANPETASDLAGKPVEVIVKFDNPDPAAIVVATETPATGKPKLLNNIFKQAKSLTNGEGVNLAEIGLIQDAKVAIGNSNLPSRFSKVFQN